MSTRARVLVVADSSADLAPFTRELHRAGFPSDVRRVAGAAALGEALAEGPWDVVAWHPSAAAAPPADTARIARGAGRDVRRVVPAAPDARLRAGAARPDVEQVSGPDIERLAAAAVGVLLRRALRAVEHREHELLEQIADVVITVDLEGRVTTANPAAEALTGRPAKRLSGTRLLDLVAPEHVEPTRDALRAAENGATATEMLVVINAEGHRVPVDLHWRAMTDAGRVVGVRGVGRDLREHRRLEEQLRQAQKMEAMGRMVSGIAHDFNNLLMAVSGYTELLLDRLAAADPLRATAEEIGKAAARAAELTSQLLAFSRRPQGVGPGVVDLNAVVADMDPMLRRLIGDEIQIAVRCAAGALPVRSDRSQMEQVLLNLIVNARDAMPGGGRLMLATARVDVDPGASAAAGVPPGTYASLEVEDTGSGMDATTLSHLYEPFFTTKAPGKGTGLGLSTVYGIVTDRGGHITVESGVGQGSRFRVLLPLAGEPATAGAARRGPGALPRGTETILLVEDETGVRELLRDFLLRCGYTVVEAGHVEQALGLFDAHEERIRLLITDLMLPRMNGRQLAERLLARRPGLKVLYISGYTDEQVRTEGPDPGTAFLQKPFTPDVLARKVRELLDAKPRPGRRAR